MGASILTIGSGKGGVGKTFLSSSLGLTLSKLNQSVLMIDFDLAGANLHTSFGLTLSEKNLRHYFDGSQKVVDLVQPTGLPRLSYLQGLWDDWALSEINVEQIRKFVDACRATDYDFVVIDLGAGAGSSNMELLKLSDERILLTNPEPASIEKLYRYVESFICHSLKENATSDAFIKIQNAIREYRTSKKTGLFSFRDYLKQSTGFSFDYFNEMEKTPTRLIVNACRSRLDQELGFAIKSVCQKYFDLPVDFLGSLDYDNAVWQSARSKTQVLIDKPFTPVAGQMLSICKTLVSARAQSNFSAKQIKAVV